MKENNSPKEAEARASVPFHYAPIPVKMQPVFSNFTELYRFSAWVRWAIFTNAKNSSR